MYRIKISKDLSNLLKVISALLVVLHHYCQYLINEGLSSNIIVKLFESQAGFIGVGVFFFLSGYGLMESETTKHLTFMSFVRKRVLKVYLPVLLVTLIWLPMYYSVNSDALQMGGVNY